MLCFMLCIIKDFINKYYIDNIKITLAHFLVDLHGPYPAVFIIKDNFSQSSSYKHLNNIDNIYKIKNLIKNNIYRATYLRICD